MTQNRQQSEPNIKQEMKEQVDNGYDNKYDKIPNKEEFVLSKKVVNES